MKFWDNVWDFSYFPAPLPNCLCHVSFKRNSPLSVKVVEKPNKCKSFLAPIFPGGRPQLFYSRLLARFSIRCLTKFGWVPFAGLRLQNLHRVGKNGGPVWSRLWTKVHEILGRCRRPVVVVNALTRFSIPCFIPKIQAIKFAVKLRSRPKRWFLGPRFVGEVDTPDFEHAFSNCTYFRACGRFWLSSVQQARRLEGEQNKEEGKKERRKNLW